MKKSEMNNLSRFFCCGYVAQVYLTCKKFTVNADEINFDAPQTQFAGDVTMIGTSTAADHLSNGKSGANHDHEKGVGKPV